MKHVFYVHSHTTWLVAQLVINRNGIKSDQVIVLQGRGVVIHPNEYKVIRYNKTDVLPSSTHRPEKEFRNSLNRNHSLIDTDYYIYLPHTANVDFIAFVSNKKCKGYHYIEEGLVSYNLKNFLKNKLSLLKRIYYSIKYHPEFYSFMIRYSYFNITHRKYLGSFSLHDESFASDRKRTLLELGDVFINKDLGLEKYDVIIIFDALSVFSMIRSEELLGILEEIVIPFMLKKSYKRIAYKLHPEHYSNREGKIEAKKIDEILKAYFHDIISISHETSIEKYLFFNNGTDLITYVSSLSLYGHILGANVYSVHHLIAKEIGSPLFPPFLLERIKLVSSECVDGYQNKLT